MLPTLGRIVIYICSEDDNKMFRSTGLSPHYEMAAMITEVMPDGRVNLKLFPNSYHSFWKENISEGFLDEETGYPHGTWHWPVIQK